MTTKRDTFFYKYIDLIKSNKYLLYMFINSGIEFLRGLCMSVGVAWGVKWITEGCVEKNLYIFTQGAVLFTFAILQSVIIVFFNEWILKCKLITFESTLRKQIVESSMHTQLDEMKDKNEILFIFDDKIKNVTQLYKTIISFIGAFGKIIGGYISGFFMSWQLLLIVVVFGIIKILITKNMLAKLSSILADIQKSSIKVFSLLTDTIEGIIFFRTSSNIEKIEKKYIGFQEEYKELQVEKGQLIVKKDLVINLFEIISFLSMLFLGAILAYQKIIDVSIFVAFISMYDLFVNPYSFINAFIQTYKNNKLGIESVMEFINCKTYEDKKPKEHIQDNFTLEVKGLTFEYNNENKIFEDLNFSCKSSEVTYIVGESGVGKTTLFNILSGWNLPKSGEIYLRFDEKTEPLDKSDITYITQTPFLFNGTIAENITLSIDNIDMEKLKYAVEKAGISDFIDGLSQKFDFIIKDKGANFSVGQRARIALARSFYKYTPIVLFDEIFASLDNLVIESIQDSIEELCKQNVCVLFITHRTELVPKVAKVIELKNLRT